MVVKVYVVLLVRLDFRDDDIARALSAIVAAGCAFYALQRCVVVIPILEFRCISFDIPCWKQFLLKENGHASMKCFIQDYLFAIK
jgi:hypothetical protein